MKTQTVKREYEVVIVLTRPGQKNVFETQVVTAESTSAALREVSHRYDEVNAYIGVSVWFLVYSTSSSIPLRSGGVTQGDNFTPSVGEMLRRLVAYQLRAGIWDENYESNKEEKENE